MPTKCCTKCGEEQDLENGFYRNSRSKDGHHPWCKKCQNELHRSYSLSKRGKAIIAKAKKCYEESHRSRVREIWREGQRRRRKKIGIEEVRAKGREYQRQRRARLKLESNSTKS